MSIMACLVQIVALWGDVMTAAYRLARPGERYDFDFVEFQTETASRLEDRNRSLMPALDFSFPQG